MARKHRVRKLLRWIREYRIRLKYKKEGKPIYTISSVVKVSAHEVRIVIARFGEPQLPGELVRLADSRYAYFNDTY